MIITDNNDIRIDIIIQFIFIFLFKYCITTSSCVFCHKFIYYLVNITGYWNSVSVFGICPNVTVNVTIVAAIAIKAFIMSNLFC